MKTQCTRSGVNLLKLCFVFLPLTVCGRSFAQLVNLTPVSKVANTKIFNSLSQNSIPGAQNDPFGTGTKFIENIGQYGNNLAGYGGMCKILYGYEGLGMPVLFTSRGLIYLQRKTKKLRYEEIEKREKRDLEGRDKPVSIDRTITMEWINANPSPQIITEDLCQDYFTYGLLKDKAKAYKKIIYKELYPGIDLVYSFNQTKKAGFANSLLIKPGADLSKVKIKYGGDVKTINQDKDGNIFINSGIDKIIITKINDDSFANSSTLTNVSFTINKNEISLKLPGNYSSEKPLNISSFVSGTGTLSGADDGKAKDIDFDYAGNVYVSGGGSGIAQKLVKYDASGVLQWTFNGTLTIPAWSFGESHGGWVVEKLSGTIYLGQGIKQSGFRIIRLSTDGCYDNYITDLDPGFVENWKMLWNCNAGVPRIFIAGGGGNSNKELAILSPPSLALSPSNLTGTISTHNDISDILIDPVTNDMYTLFSISILSPSSDNKIYRHKPPYSSADITWFAKPGYFNLREPVNRPYLNGLDNSSNTIAINTRYLFYWDGKNLKAFNKSDGSEAGAAISIDANTALMQGGIFADECDNVFVGSANGIIKVYKFNGDTFNDNAADDISIAGYGSSAIYDMVYDEGRGLLYTCGNGFVTSVDLSAYCSKKVYTVNVVPSCSSVSVTASISPSPPAGSSVTYNLFEGSTQIAGNSTGYFTGLNANTAYSVVAYINQSCSGLQSVTAFTTSSPVTLKINTPSAICSDSVIDLTAAAITAGSTTGLTFSYWSDTAATIAFSAATKAGPGTYYIKGATPAGCSVIEPVVVKAIPAPQPDAGADTVICFGSTLQLKGTGGSSYYWSPSTYLDNPKISNPKIINPGTGNIIYHLKVKDAFGCSSLHDADVKITFSPIAKIFIDSDTLAAINEPLQINAVDVNNSGFKNYMWSPPYGLNNPFIANPIAILGRDMTYTLHASNENHCTAEAMVTIKVFKRPEFYVPNSFTPNGDGLNDVLKAVPVGMQEFHYLKIFNRFGQLLFTTTDPAKGWDGKINGRELDYGTFIWIGEGIDYKGNIIQRKGSFLLIK